MRILSRVEIVRALAYGKIVDIGCFDGQIFGDKAINVDFKFYGVRVPNFVLADAHSLPFKNRVFNCCVMSELLEHIDDPINVIEEAQRIATTVIITVPNEYEWKPDLNPFTNPGHKHFFNQQSLLQLVYESGLQLIELIKVNFMGWSHFVVMGVSKDVQVSTR